jgi:hypothetical protein
MSFLGTALDKYRKRGGEKRQKTAVSSDASPLDGIMGFGKRSLEVVRWASKLPRSPLRTRDKIEKGCV